MTTENKKKCGICCRLKQLGSSASKTAKAYAPTVKRAAKSTGSAIYRAGKTMYQNAQEAYPERMQNEFEPIRPVPKRKTARKTAKKTCGTKKKTAKRKTTSSKGYRLRTKLQND